MKLAISGHRPEKLGLDYSHESRKLTKEFAIIILSSIAKLKHIIVGMAQGIDQAFAEAAIELNIPFDAALPFAGQELRWPASSQRKYHEILEKASEAHIVCQKNEVKSLFTRNQFMVDWADHLLYILKPGETGGTYECVKYCEKLGKYSKNFWPAFEDFIYEHPIYRRINNSRKNRLKPAS
jgi:uncharacterized phage-like protein YoqJ